MLESSLKDRVVRWEGLTVVRLSDVPGKELRYQMVLTEEDRSEMRNIITDICNGESKILTKQECLVLTSLLCEGWTISHLASAMGMTPREIRKTRNLGMAKVKYAIAPESCATMWDVCKRALDHHDPKYFQYQQTLEDHGFLFGAHYGFRKGPGRKRQFYCPADISSLHAQVIENDVELGV